MRRIVALFLLVAGLFGVTLATAPSALAHATLVASDPVDGSRLKTAPSAVSVTFDEAVTVNSAGYLRVVDQVGRRVDTGRVAHPNGAKVSVPLKSGLGDGTYTASYRIVSDDGHPVAGSIRFVVGNGALAAATGSLSTVDGATSVAFDVVRWLGFAGMALLGGGWLLLTVWPEGRDDVRARRLVWAGWLAAVVAAMAELLVQGPYVAGAGLGDVTNWSLLDATLHTTYGTAHSDRLLLLAAIAVALDMQLRELRRSRIAERVTGTLAVGVAVTYGVSGHAQAQDPHWLAITSDSAHLAAMAVWVGGLAYLLFAVLPRREPAELRRVLPVVSRVAFCAIAVLAVTGTYQAWLGIGAVDAITTTRYGQYVLIKVALFAGLLALGNLSRVAVQRHYVRPVAYAMTDDLPVIDDEPDLGPVRRSVLAEAVIAVVVLGVTAVLVAEPPGRAALAATRAEARSSTVALGGGRSATVTLDPGRHGPVSVTVGLSPGARAQKLTATAALPAKQLGPITVPLTTTDGATYSASGVVLPSAGRWTITLTVTTSEFDAVVADAKIRLY
ncbi:MAG TPA: copper resistance protein CopC [Jatrophihabitantaceae bacterium]